MENPESNIKRIFDALLGVDVILKKDSANKKEFFCNLIETLEASCEIEGVLLGVGGINLTNVTDPLWIAIENLLEFTYGTKATDLIMWYIFDRLDEKGEVIPLVTIDGKQFIMNGPSDLWNLLDLVNMEMSSEEDEDEDEDE
jgi:hypothetical protein